MCGFVKPLTKFKRSGKAGYERICYGCRDRAEPEDWAEARRMTHKMYEGHRA